MDPKRSSDNFPECFFDTQNLPKEEQFSCYLCSTTYEKDLQLAAELGKTLLERNKELETSLKNHQNVIEDQSQEIEYLTKQTSALKEVNTSRIKIYEQLEISIQELEHSKETLSRQNAADKKQIKSLQETVGALENKCDDLQSTVDRLVAELENEKRQRMLDSMENKSELPNHHDTTNKRNSIEFCENYVNLSTQIQELKTTHDKDQKIIVDQRDQISVLLKETNYLQELLDDQLHKDEELKTLQEELATFDQIRVGNLCKRCLRSIIPTEDCSSTDDLSLVLASEEEQDFAKSVASALFNGSRSSPMPEGGLGDNPYRMLVEKYEALLKMQEQQAHCVRRQPSTTKPAQCMSLRDELQHSGNFNFKEDMTDSEFEDERDDHQEARQNTVRIGNQKSVTSCPNLGDDGDVVHKGTQTDVHALPGSFLCKISDGNDCQFSIYDDASPVESRFRKTPEYRQLFKEIFAVLKRAAEAKDEGESLPLLDDRLPAYMPSSSDVFQQPKVPPVTPAREEQPFIVPNTALPGASLSEGSKLTEHAFIKLPQTLDIKQTTENVADIGKSSQQLDVMEHLMAGVRPKRNLSRGERRGLVAAGHKISPSPSPSNSRSSSNRRSGSKARKKREHLTDSPNHSRERGLVAGGRRVSPSPSPSASRSSSKRRSGSKARKKRDRFTDSPSHSRERHQQKSSRPVDDFDIFAKMSENKVVQEEKRARPVSMYAFGNGNCSASMEVAKLKYLEKSYAEVLRMGRKKAAGDKTAFMSISFGLGEGNDDAFTKYQSPSNDNSNFD